MFTFLSLPCFRRWAILALGTLLGGLALAQDYPNRPITLVMPYAAGGPGDVITRIYAAALQKSLGQQVVVENPAGAAGSIGTAKVARSKPDGYTLLMIHVSHATNPFMFKSLSYNPVEDFEPIGLATEGPMLLVARKDFPARDAREFLDYVRANASKLSMGHAGPGSAAHLCNLKFMQALKVDITQVPYKGAAPALNDLMGGQLDLMCDQTSNNLPTVQSGRVRAYAVAGTQRLAQVPDVPSLQEAGLSGFEISIFFGMYAPKGTPKPVLDRLTAALQQAVRDPDVKARLAALATLPVPVEKARPEALRAHLKSEIDTLGPLLQGAGIKPE
ncbi:MAG: tripartite tricarboxylate transporter substrate binding protein BugD [Limnohabitans sp.]|jgi:tripartite-type tricarboxylate transporter receptor subunit TctC|nr:tripartite tricarboxylate transporter substrate binding protein BugD [Limnohabitans sp.]